MMIIPLSFSNRKSQFRWRSLGITLFIVYLLLFSVFALFHAYAANELDSSNGCDIGEWIHLGLQAAVFFVLVVASTLLFDLDRSPALPFVKTLLWSDPFKRGPPLLTY